MDLIKREDAIKALTEVLFDEPPYLNSIEKCETFARKTLESIPSVEPTIEIDADQLAKLLREGWTIHSEPKQGEWIPCSERLPERLERVLVTRANGRVEETFKWNNEEYPWNGGYDDVLAWMPLPEPWKGA